MANIVDRVGVVTSVYGSLIGDPAAAVDRVQRNGYHAVHLAWLQKEHLFPEGEQQLAEREHLMDNLRLANGDASYICAIAMNASIGGVSFYDNALAHLHAAFDSDVYLLTGHIPILTADNKAKVYDDVKKVVAVASVGCRSFAYETRDSPKAAAELLDANPDLKICFDAANLVREGYSDRDILYFLDKYKERVALVHIKDAKKGVVDGQKGETADLGEGDTPNEDVIRMLKDVYEGPFILELGGPIDAREGRLQKNRMALDRMLRTSLSSFGY